MAGQLYIELSDFLPLVPYVAERHFATMDLNEKPLEADHKYNEDIADAPYVPDPAEEKALVRRIDRRLLPVLWVMYIFNYIDRVSSVARDSNEGPILTCRRISE